MCGGAGAESVSEMLQLRLIEAARAAFFESSSYVQQMFSRCRGLQGRLSRVAQARSPAMTAGMHVSLRGTEQSLACERIASLLLLLLPAAVEKLEAECSVTNIKDVHPCELPQVTAS